ncbi:MAG: hypothetical protein FJW49_04545 [Actinobacteria bacterium]|nr:hypothetical protein [Actinomycetota bacterium]
MDILYSKVNLESSPASAIIVVPLINDAEAQQLTSLLRAKATKRECCALVRDYLSKFKKY